jgi:uncharacterized integral membrane protein (TIGR00697 family)
MRKLLILCGIFIASLVVCNVISTKLWVVGGYIMSAGILAYPICFLLSNVVNEVWGKKIASYLVWSGFLVNILTIILCKAAMLLPPLDKMADASFVATLETIPRIILACNVAYLLAQYGNILVFSSIKEKMNNKAWFRNCCSTVVGQLIDCFLFYIIAFAPFGLGKNEMTVKDLINGLLLSLTLKVIISVLTTPVFYCLVYWVCGGWPKTVLVPKLELVN